MKRACRNCDQILPAIARADAIYCSSACRTFAHRNPFPKEMISLRRWIRYSKTKVPLTPDDGVASSTHPHTWSDYPWVAESNAGVGMGFVFNGDGIIGIDLDKAFDENGKLKFWAQAIVDLFSHTYIEYSPSGKGLHIIGRGEVQEGRRWQIGDGGIEIYGTSRYFTMTGKRFERTPKKLAKIGKVVEVISPIAEADHDCWQTA